MAILPSDQNVFPPAALNPNAIFVFCDPSSPPENTQNPIPIFVFEKGLVIFIAGVARKRLLKVLLY
jgi:hypothetical protein